MKEYIVRYENEYLQLMPDKMQELVRCKGCKHYFNGCCYSRVSNRINFTVEVPDDWFCADGERQEGR